ncbi:hypothetical protein L210DRAFT_3587856, partial [Boletus edulis BED1]
DPLHIILLFYLFSLPFHHWKNLQSQLDMEPLSSLVGASRGHVVLENNISNHLHFLVIRCMFILLEDLLQCLPSHARRI